MSSALTVKLTILCSGLDAAGKAFEERTRTTAIERSGGRLLIQHKLEPGARIVLRLLARPDRAAEVVMGEALQDGDEGVERSFQFASPADDFWGVRFPGEQAAMPPPEGVAAGSAGSALVEMTDQLVLLAAHADDHLRYCSQELEVLRQSFAREVQGALDAAGRQLQQLARSTMQTTFRSLLEDLAHKAEQTVDDNLNRLRKAMDETGVQHGKYLAEAAEAQLQKFQERLEKQGRQLAAHLEQLQEQSERAMQEAMQAALAEFQAGCAGLLRDLLHSTETHKPSRAPATRRK